MKIYHDVDATQDDFIDAFLKTLEKDTKKKIFTMKILEQTINDGLEAVVVFEDKTVLYGNIRVMEVNKKLAMRMQGNWI